MPSGGTRAGQQACNGPSMPYPAASPRTTPHVSICRDMPGKSQRRVSVVVPLAGGTGEARCAATSRCTRRERTLVRYGSGNAHPDHDRICTAASAPSGCIDPSSVGSDSCDHPELPVSGSRAPPFRWRGGRAPSSRSREVHTPAIAACQTRRARSPVPPRQGPLALRISLHRTPGTKASRMAQPG